MDFDMDFKQLYRTYTRYSYEELLDLAKESLVHLIPYFEQYAEDFVDEYLLGFVSTAIALDGCITKDEYRFFCDITGVKKSFEEVGEAISCYDNDYYVDLVQKVFASMPQTIVRTYLLNLLMAVFASDSIMAYDESVLFIRLLRS